MGTIRFACISLECDRIQPRRQPNNVDIYVAHRRSVVEIDTTFN